MRKNRCFFPVAALLAAISPASVTLCAAEEPSTEKPELATQDIDTGPLESAIWLLESYRVDGETRVSSSSHPATIRLRDGQLSGSGGCNRLMGSYELYGTQLSATVSAMTMMACPEGMDQEQAVAAALGKVRSYQLDGDRLTLFDEASEPVLVFTELQPMPLIGTSWSLAFYNNGKQALVSPLSGTEIRLELGDDGNLGGHSGCNRYFGPYRLERSGLEIGPIAASRMACLRPEGLMEQESAYLRALATVTGYQVEGSELRLLNADGKVAARFRAQRDETAPEGRED
ncbi:MAG: META domain-containing protein [Pseudomonadota bacterium]|nr:META domain-containing protein [Pseudomonadota bacterium]